MENNPWTVKGEKEIYDNRWIRVTEFDVLNPAGGKGIYGTVHFKNIAVGVVVLDDDMYTWLVGQYRFATNQYSWEIPEGGSPVDQDPMEGAKRELMEEAGLSASEWTQLFTMQMSNSVSDEIAVIYLARGISQHTSSPEDTEQLTVKRVPFEEAYGMVERGEITDSMSVAAILKVKLLIVGGELIPLQDAR